MNLKLLRDELILDEGLRHRLYKCSAGKMTIGIGYNIEEHGLPSSIIEELFEKSVADARTDLDRALPWWTSQPEQVQRGMLNMVFNLGIGRFLKFERMIGALGSGAYTLAATEALDSKWARQVGERAERIAKLFRNANLKGD